MKNHFLPSRNHQPLFITTYPSLQFFLVILFSIGSAVTALALVAYGTSVDPWVHSDSVAYLMTAHNFANGLGFGLLKPSGEFAPLTLHPPLYSLILSLAGAKLEKTLALARYLNILSFAILNLILFQGLFWKGKNIGLAVSIGLLTLCSPMPLYLFTGAMSEPLFIFLAISSLFVLCWALCAHSVKLEVVAAFLLAFAILLRFAGYGFIAAAVIALLLLRQVHIWSRLARSALFAVIAVIPQILWLLYLQFVYQLSQPRRFSLPAMDLWDATETFRLALVQSLWEFLPFSNRIFVEDYPRQRLILLFLGMGMILLVITTWLTEYITKLPLDKSRSALRLLGTVAGFYAFGYITFLVVAFLLAEPQPDINTRMLAPVLIPIWICWGCALVFLGRCFRPFRFLIYMPLLFAGVGLLSGIPQNRDILMQLHQQGAGYTGTHWKNSGVIELVKDLPEDIDLISNDSSAILLLTGRSTYDIPELINRTRLTTYTRFGADLDDPVQEVFRSEEAVLVLFETIIWQLDPIYFEDASARLEAFTDGLNLIEETHDGALYSYGK